MGLISHGKKHIIENDISRVREYSAMFTQQITFDKLLLDVAKVDLCPKEVQFYREIFGKNYETLIHKGHSKRMMDGITWIGTLTSKELNIMQRDLSLLFKDKKSLSTEEFSKLLLSTKLNKNHASFLSLDDISSIFNYFDLDRDGNISAE